ncbi:protein-ribulosamine kinase [Salix suchowensis]|nr:protein-ribulosamine kinase [Salix suchowensis]
MLGALVFVLSSRNLYLILVIVKRVSGFLVISLYCNDLVMGFFDACIAAMSDDPISVWILSEGNATQITWTSSIGGGCINNARRMLVLFLQKQTGMVGIEPSLFEGEALCLGAMYETRTIQVPGPFKVGPLPTSGSYIMMEFIEFGVCRGNQFVLGRKLAEMHKTRSRPVMLDPACYYGHSEAEFGMSWCASSGGSFYNAYFECPVLKSLVMLPNVLPCQCQGNSCHSLAQPCNSGSSIWIPKGKVASTTF